MTFASRLNWPDDGSCDYRQTSHYEWDDGSTQDFVFEADINPETGRLEWDNGRISGALRAIEPLTLYLHFRYADQPGSRVAEMMQLSECGLPTAPWTWHWFQDEALVKLTLVNEVRAG